MTFSKIWLIIVTAAISSSLYHTSAYAHDDINEKLLQLITECDTHPNKCEGIVLKKLSFDGFIYQTDPSFCKPEGKGSGLPICKASNRMPPLLECIIDSNYCNSKAEVEVRSGCYLKPNIEDGWCCFDSVQNIKTCGVWQ